MEPGALLEQVRRRNGLTQADLARRAGTSQPVISAYEHGHRDPTYGTLRRLVAAAGAELRLEAVSGPAGGAGDLSRLPPPRDLAEHAERLLDVLSLADAIPVRRRSAELDAPRIVST
jgi:transcriptional regulator with XRE-family HTH domain